MRSKSFALGCAASFALLVVANYHSYTRMLSSTCDDCYISFGFPFRVWVEGGFVGITQIVWSGVVANIAIAICAGLVSGWAVEQLSKPRIRLP